MDKTADLRRWFKEKWIDISRKDSSGKHPECGRPDADKGAYPKCRPAKKISKETPTTAKSLSSKEKKKAVNIKRRKERTAPNEPAGGGARKPKYTKLSEDQNMTRSISKRAKKDMDFEIVELQPENFISGRHHHHEEGDHQPLSYHDDEELYMIKKNLYTMNKQIKELCHSVDSGKDVPEWCQEKIAVAAAMMDAVYEYMCFDLYQKNKMN